MAKGDFCSVTPQTRARDIHNQSPLLYSIRRFIHLAHLTSLQVMRYCTVWYIGGQRLCPNQEQWQLIDSNTDLLCWRWCEVDGDSNWFGSGRNFSPLPYSLGHQAMPYNTLFEEVFSYIQHLQLCPCIDRVFNCWSTDKMLVGWGDSSEHRTLEGGFTFIHTCFYSLALWVVHYMLKEDHQSE